ncbi:MORN repeat-containing protein [Spirochaeta isovalerica]|uniref:MORN repeat protein n=1 Tax=Spirochaeta isovalerica TaxID=150 RepID=A0A841RDL3_9SPIO|nr:hypothetical protein [Spirochaeta isovalerica]MBB6482063.1 hypothetical protein [Spirochaeta isovalerica]
MDDYLDFSGPVKLIIVERALVENRNGKFRERDKNNLTRIIFDNRGKPVSELRENSSIEYQYDDEGNLYLIRKKDKSGTLLEETRMSYRKGTLQEQEKSFPDGSVREKKAYRYDGENRLVSESTSTRHIRYEYRNGQVFREYRYYGKEPELAIEYKRDRHGRPIRIETFSKEGSTLRKELMEWEEDRLSRWTIWGREGLLLKRDRFEYSCFHDGNWLKRIRYSAMETETEIPVEVVYRSIAYSDSYPEIKPVHKEETRVLSETSQALTFSDGSIYRGEIREGKMEGKGYIQWPDGSSYKGEFRNNRMDGQGILTWPNGDIYSGMFTEGQMEGVGRLRWSGGKTFYGLFENNRRTNQGIIEEE